ncbi:N-formyl peptide receptor 2-like [Bombina bombina]|uniref:N-formyl peptide receptor 2-like n=1 Tax=Bombina bombina TaxID=8345 RepID=UPI00235A5A22|nr:N-formyl peptide receptor 2-like [Bombina bombina]
METNEFLLQFIYNTTDTYSAEEDWSYFNNEHYNHLYLLEKVITIICYSITFIFGILGNGLVIWIAGFKIKKNVNTIWFLNLGVADFAFNLCLPLPITELVMDHHWPFGLIMCKAVFTALLLNMSVSTSFLMIISVDRCTSVLCPVWSKNHRTCRLAYIISAVIWFLCLIFSSPYSLFYDIYKDSDDDDDDDNKTYCHLVYVSWHNISAFDYDTWRLRYNASVITKFVFMFIIPFLSILVCYGLIMLKVRKRKSLSASGRTFKVIIAIILSFFICWFPFQLWPLLETMGIEIEFYVYTVVLQLFSCLAFFNSCLNPMLYVFIGRDFKRSLFKSIPFLMESTFKEKYDIDSESQCNQTRAETELEIIYANKGD